MRRRDFIKGAAALALQPFVLPHSLLAIQTAQAAAAPRTLQRVRPSDEKWPSPSRWDALDRATGGRLVKVRSPLNACRAAPDSKSCTAVFHELKNPYYAEDNPALTQTCGWLDAWTAQPSAYAVAARSAKDVAAAVNFARDNNLRLVVKGAGHSYLGTSNAPDSLLIWTRHMNDIALHSGFVPRG